MSIHSDADPLFSQVVLLLNNNGSTITDDSLYGRAPSVLGGAVTSATQKKFGGKSLQRPSGNVLRFAASTDFTPGTGDFTVEFYRYVTSSTATTYQLARANGGSAGRWALGENGTNKLSWWYLGSAIVASPTNTTYGVWQHCAYSRSGGTGYLCCDGAVVASGADTNNYSSTDDLSFFGDQSSGVLSDAGVYLDFVRITIGAGRYTGSYTPPEAASDRMRLIVAAPMQTVALIGNGNFSLSAPMQAIALYTGAQAAITAPTQTLAAALGSQITIAAPMQTVRMTAHDASNDNALRITAPMQSVTMRGGMAARMTGPSPVVEADMTGTALLSAALRAPLGAVSMEATVSAMMRAALSGPSPTVQSFTGARIALVGPMGAALASGQGGAVGSFTLTCPVFDLTAEMTRQANAQFQLTAPSPTMGEGRLRAAMTAPSAQLAFTGYAVVAVTYEAYALNLKHATKNPVDELTRYTNFPFTAIVRFRGEYIGVGTDGLYHLTGTTDYASPTPTAIPWAWRTGITDFDNPAKKTIESAYFGGRLPATVTVTLYAGEDGSAAYSHTNVRGDEAQNYRQKFGRGVKQRYYALGAAGSGELTLDNIEFNVAQLARRI